MTSEGKTPSPSPTLSTLGRPSVGPRSLLYRLSSLVVSYSNSVSRTGDTEGVLTRGPTTKSLRVCGRGGTGTLVHKGCVPPSDSIWGPPH